MHLNGPSLFHRLAPTKSLLPIQSTRSLDNVHRDLKTTRWGQYCLTDPTSRASLCKLLDPPDFNRLCRRHMQMQKEGKRVHTDNPVDTARGGPFEDRNDIISVPPCRSIQSHQRDLNFSSQIFSHSSNFLQRAADTRILQIKPLNMCLCARLFNRHEMTNPDQPNNQI